LLAVRDYLDQGGKYHCVYFNAEVGQYARENVSQGIKAILGEMVSRARTSLGDIFPQEKWQEVLEKYGEGTALNQVLTQWAEESAKHLVFLSV
jgi:hypothetical protein